MPAESFEPIRGLQILPDGIRRLMEIIQAAKRAAPGLFGAPSRRAATFKQHRFGLCGEERVEFFKGHFTQAAAPVSRKCAGGLLLHRDKCESARESDRK